MKFERSVKTFNGNADGSIVSSKQSWEKWGVKYDLKIDLLPEFLRGNNETHKACDFQQVLQLSVHLKIKVKTVKTFINLIIVKVGYISKSIVVD